MSDDVEIIRILCPFCAYTIRHRKGGKIEATASAMSLGMHLMFNCPVWFTKMKSQKEQ